MKKGFNEPIHQNEKTTKFTPPSIEQVIDQFQIKGCYVQKEALGFYYHYESNGWHVGRTKMRSWRSAVAGWINRMDQFNANKPTVIKPTDTSEKTDQVKLQEQDQIRRAYQNQKS